MGSPFVSKEEIAYYTEHWAYVDEWLTTNAPEEVRRCIQIISDINVKAYKELREIKDVLDRIKSGELDEAL